MFGWEPLQSENAERLAKKVLEASVVDDVEADVFETFTTKLVTTLKTAMIAPSTVKCGLLFVFYE